MPGTWLDSQTGKIVDKPPAEGVQLSSPNIDEDGPAEQQNIDLAKRAASASPKEREEELAVAQPEPGPELDRNVAPTDADEASKTVSSRTAAPKGKK